MKIEPFVMEREQAIWENRVKYNLSESGVHPLSVREILDEDEIKNLLDSALFYCQSNGSDELKQVISNLYPGSTPDQVMVTNGTIEANFLATLALLDSGDEILFMVPSYLQIQSIARSFGITIKPFHLREELGWGVDLDHLRSIVTPKTKMIAVCHPNNPTGAVLDEETIQAIHAIADDAGAYILSDEVYRGAELNGIESPSFFRPGDEKTIINSGLSKAYGLPGLRVGWTLGSSDYAAKAWANHDISSISVGTLSDKIAIKVLQPATRKKILTRTRRILNDNIVLIQEWVDSHGDLFRFTPPRAGAIAYIGYNLPIGSIALVEKIREDTDVFICAGEWFDLDGFIRIGYGESKAYLSKALTLIDKVLNEIQIKPKSLA